MRIEESKPFDREAVEKQLTELGVEFKPGAHHKTLLKLLEAQKHTLTQEDFDNNPDLVEEGLSVGDEVYLPVATEEDAEAEETQNAETPEVAEEVAETTPADDAVDAPDASDEAEPALEPQDGVYTVKTPLKRDGKIYRAGETLELLGTEAKMLIEQGVIA